MNTKAYGALFITRTRLLLQYRIAALAGLLTQAIFGLIMINVLMAFFEHSGQSQPMTLAQSVTYTWLGQALLGNLPWRIDGEIGDSIRLGTVAYDLTRPLDLYSYWFARIVALRVAPTLLKSIPMFVIATFLLPARFLMQWPPLPSLAAWLVTFCGAVLLSSAITVWMQSTMFWTVSGDGITRILPHFVTLLSGMVIPLPLMPAWAQTFLRLQPFSSLVSRPNELFCQVLAPGEVWSVLALQLVWSAVFILLGRMTLRRGLHRLSVAGG